MYKWYTNGQRNKKIFEGKEIPEGFSPGYVLTKDKMKRLTKLTNSYNERIKKLEEHYKQIFEKKKDELEKELTKKQQEITFF
jgi:predicted nuclease with TOPRIM domain